MPSLLTRRKSVLGVKGDKSGSQQVDPNNNKEPGHDDGSLHPSAAAAAAAATTRNNANALLLPRPVSVGGEYASLSASRLSHELHPDDIAETSTDHDAATRSRKRFSLMKFRNYSESHLAARAKLDAERVKVEEELPPVPAVTAEGVVPTIVKTAPTMGHEQAGAQQAEVGKQERPSLFRKPTMRLRTSEQNSRASTEDGRSGKKGSSLRWRRGKTSGLEDLHRLSTMHINDQHSAPPSYGEHPNSALAVPVAQGSDPRFSESSRSDGSSGDGHIYGSTTTTTHTVQTHTTFFKLPRRNKNRNSLFPLPVKLPPPGESQPDRNGSTTPRASMQSFTPESQTTPSTEVDAEPTTLRRSHTEASTAKRGHTSSGQGSPKKGSLSFADPGLHLFGQTSSHSQASNTSSPLQPPMRLGLRDRSSTQSSLGGRSGHDAETPPPLSASGRNSTSTTGRPSFGGLLTLSRFRQGSEPHSPRHGSLGTRSKSNSFAMSREALVVPEREEGDTPGKYLERLESAVSRSVIAGILSKSSDPFAQAVLRSYTRRFPFFTEPIDMSLRKFLLEAELPKETQQVDRVIQAFADRYHECNPGIYATTDSAYIIAFSIMMLHTDAFNRNNKRKMQKHDYIKNTSGQGISDEILACFYDNICYTPFIHYDEDVDINGERVLHFTQPKKSGGKLKSAIPGASDIARKPSGPVDPYNLIVEQKLDTLRPAIKDSIMMDDPYDYRGSSGELDPHYLQRAFTHTGIIQIISARSRPAAYESQLINGQPNLTETQQGIVDLKITKVGLLWRKSAKKKKTRSPWQEWGAILTGSQLYLFKNSHWAKGLMHQFVSSQRPGQPRMPVVFKPPLQDFKPDALIKTDNAVALVDATYTRHKNAFTFIRNGGQEEVLLADNEGELHDWLGLINYAAAFRAAGVRIRGMTGGSEESANSQSLKRLESTHSSRSFQTDNGEVTVSHRGLGPQLQKQVMAARRQIMVQKIAEIESEIENANRQLENMLRNARHLLLLAPIAPRSREDVVLAAGRADATIKWLRRDMWRMKCHRDILAMDVRIDGMTAAELEKLTQHPESSRKDKTKMLTRFGSHRHAKSPPQSPSALTFNRPPTRDSMDASETFTTPPQAGSPPKDDAWRLPPLSLNAPQQEQHRPSVTSTLLSVSPPSSHMSLQHSHSASSILQVRSRSTDHSENDQGNTLAPAVSVDGRELRLLARATMVTENAITDQGTSIDGPALGTSPESSKHKSVRRSLQKTLREHHHPSSSHRHRRNKESDSTVRSGNVEGLDIEEATPGLAREKPRFILHGKQASVVQFGGDWERMKLRREQYEAGRSSTEYQSQLDAAYHRRRSEAQQKLRAGTTSPVVHEFTHSSATDEDDDTASMLSEGSRSFRSDAEAAAVFAAAGPSGKSSDSEEPSDFPSFDLSDWDPVTGRRTTVLGPFSPVLPPLGSSKHRRFSSLQKGSDGNIEDVDDDESHQQNGSRGHVSTSASEYSTSPPGSRADLVAPPNISKSSRENRRTVIGPSTSPLASAHGRLTSSTSVATSTTGDEGESSSSARSSLDGEHGFVRAIGDDELRSMSSSLNSSPQTVRSR
ncbi:Putative Sec7 domain, pleckstrin domain, PH-like domain superfamily, sec7 domain superfamily [Septoria linicola]|uniref:Sec7 domain, pleckstrin domain, PH-like domain superfamily, sec7 domain superfamily n=1 Tax=Septoria linicola TaxID=215465 RepID=A0A9Q9AMZ8_9PEZI|nr:putative Sec7 domain, pleckstrin domain, PH-like domain superfamily, sec7 domain superfamily [Septoria linicola]USW52279.1 Putative Sec7 domain, pleckstrin domain, PH-like domain superfamily, sec7 domain superfamily [Septoria linicola]